MAARRDIYSGKDPRELPLYSPGEAALYLGIPVSTLRSWAGLKSYPIKGGRRRMKPLIKLDADTAMFTFNSFVEAFILASLTRRFRVPLQKVRNAVTFLGGERPLLTTRLKTDRAGIYVEQYSALVDASSGGQTALRAVLEDMLHRVDFDKNDLPTRFYPWRKDLDEPKVVTIDPRRAFGRPTVVDRGVKVEVIIDRYRAGDSLKFLANEYDMPTEIIEGVVRWGLDGAAAADPLTYYLDENVDGPEMAELLAAGGLKCERHRDHFKHGDADADWIPVVAQRGWVAVTRDVQISHKEVERQAWITAGAIVVILRGKGLATAQMASALITARPVLEPYVAKRMPPMVIHLSPDGGFKLVEGGQRRGGVKKDAK